MNESILNLLAAKDRSLAHQVAKCIQSIISDTGTNKDAQVEGYPITCQRVAEMQPVAPQTPRSKSRNQITPMELDALKSLALSKNRILSLNASQTLVDLHNHGDIPEGTLVTSAFLEHLDVMLQDTSNFWGPVVAMELGNHLAHRGALWQDRMLERSWLHTTLDTARKLCQPERTASSKRVELILEKALSVIDAFDLTNRCSSPLNASEASQKAHKDWHSLIESLIHFVAIVPELYNTIQSKQAMNAVHLQLIDKSVKAFSTLAKAYRPEREVCDPLKWDPTFKVYFCDQVIVSFARVAVSAVCRVAVIEEIYSEKIVPSIAIETSTPRNQYHLRTTRRQSITGLGDIDPTTTRQDGVAGLLAELLDMTKLACNVLSALREACGTQLVAESLAVNFRALDMIFVINTLYDSRYAGAKYEIATFLNALVRPLDEAHKSLLCESGIIIRLLRLASPSAIHKPSNRSVECDSTIDGTVVYSEAPFPLQNGESQLQRSPNLAVHDAQSAAFLPAIQCLTELAKVDTIGARIMLSGGLGPLYSHANSIRSTRDAARQALEVLGLHNLNDVIDTWIQLRHSKNNDTPIQNNIGQANGSQTSQSETNGLADTWLNMNSIQRINGDSVQLSAQHVLLDGESNSIGTANDPHVWEQANIIGTGAFSSVYSASVPIDVLQMQGSFSNYDFAKEINNKSATRYPVAVKRLTRKAMSDPGFVQEIRILAKLPMHRNLASLLGVAIDSDHRCLILTQLGGHTLSHYLSTVAKPDVSPICSNWSIRLDILGDIASALQTLHSMEPAILHLDLKSSNVLVSKDNTDGCDKYVAKLCDFGLAVELQAGFEFLSPSNHGTLQWMAPEVMEDEAIEISRGFDQHADVFSFAIVMWEVAHPGKIPWADELAVTSQDARDQSWDAQDQIRSLVCNGYRLRNSNVEAWPSGYERLMRRCWRHDPADRPLFTSRTREGIRHSGSSVSSMLLHRTRHASTVIPSRKDEGVHICIVDELKRIQSNPLRRENSIVAQEDITAKRKEVWKGLQKRLDGMKQQHGT